MVMTVPIVSIILGVGIFLVGILISRANNSFGEIVSIVGGIFGAPIIYAGFIFVRYRATWGSVLCALAGVLATCGLTYLEGASYLHSEKLHHDHKWKSDESIDAEQGRRVDELVSAESQDSE